MKIEMTKSYKILFDDRGIYGVAKTLKTGPNFTLPDSGTVEDWQTLILDLVEGDFADYLASNLGCRLCSKRLKDLLDSHASSVDELQWLPVIVREGTEQRPYSILHFPNPPDVLNKEKSLFARYFVVKPVLSEAAVGNHQVFSYPGGGEITLFVSRKVKLAIKSAGYSGMELSSAAML
jgi:hypothetical protein